MKLGALYETVLSGDLAGNDNPDPMESGFAGYAENSLHVVRFGYTSESFEEFFIEGFTIRGGNANGEPGDPGGGDNSGAGIYMCGYGDTKLVRRCRIIHNRAEWGGGLYNAFACSGEDETAFWALVIDCFIGENAADYGGGAMADRFNGLELRRCEISGNKAGSGGGIGSAKDSWVRLIDCRLMNNEATSTGGGARFFETHATAVNCVIAGNSAYSGGGIADVIGYGPHLFNCLICNNTAVQRGGGLSGSDSPYRVLSCTIVGNVAETGGGMVNKLNCLYAPSNVTVRNTIISGNDATSDVGEAIALFNWDHPCFSELNVANSLVAGGIDGIPILGEAPGYTVVWGPGNIDADPAFVDSDGADDDPWTWSDNQYRLRSGSPCIDAGDDAWVPADAHDIDEDGDTSEVFPYDLAQRSRISTGGDGVVDLGAFEHQPCAADFNGSGAIGFSDLVAVLQHWGACPLVCTWDVTGDGAVDFADLTALLVAWGGCRN